MAKAKTITMSQLRKIVAELKARCNNAINEPASMRRGYRYALEDVLSRARQEQG